LSFELGVLGFWHWNSGFGFWALEQRFLVLGFEFWVSEYGFYHEGHEGLEG